jgi:hypothetical protein
MKKTRSKKSRDTVPLNPLSELFAVFKSPFYYKKCSGKPPVILIRKPPDIKSSNFERRTGIDSASLRSLFFILARQAIKAGGIDSWALKSLKFGLCVDGTLSERWSPEKNPLMMEKGTMHMSQNIFRI